MSDPPRAPRPANATIEIDKSELDEILSATPSAASVQASLPPPLPPEEIARAQSMAPVQQMVSGAAPPHTKPSLLPYILISVTLMVLAGVAAAAVLYTSAARRENATPVASASAVVTSEASASPSVAPAGTTLTIHTVELGGKSSE